MNYSWTHPHPKVSIVVLERWKLLTSQPLRRSTAGQIGELVGQMRLVVEAADGRHLRDRYGDGTACNMRRPARTGPLARRAWVRAEFVGELSRQMLAAPSCAEMSLTVVVPPVLTSRSQA